MAKSAQSSVMTTWNKLSFANKVYSVLFLFLLVAMAVSIPFVAGDKQLGELRSKASENCKSVPKYGQGCTDEGNWKGVNCTVAAPCCDKNMYLGQEQVCEGDGQGGGGEDDPTDGANSPPPGGGVCDAAGNCAPPPGSGGGGGSTGGSTVKKQPTKPDRETMKAICSFIIDFIEEEGLPETSEDTKALKQYLKAHNTEYRGWGKIDQFSGSEIYRFAKQYCPNFPTPTPTPTP